MINQINKNGQKIYTTYYTKKEKTYQKKNI